jgi:ABC-type uncharacterized transport system fused permease/ATPase subunit
MDFPIYLCIKKCNSSRCLLALLPQYLLLTHVCLYFSSLYALLGHVFVLIQHILKSHLADGRCGERLRDGVKTVIVGEPNVGKSSLLNVLCKYWRE